MMNPDSFTEEASKQSMEVVAWFLLDAYSQIREERDKLRAKFLNKKEPALVDWENFLPIQIPKKMRKWALERTLRMGMSQLQPERFRGVTPGSNQPCLQEQGIEMGSSRKNLWRTLQFIDTDPPDICRRLLRQHEHAQPGLEETQMRRREGRMTLRAEPQSQRPKKVGPERWGCHLGPRR